MRAAGVVMNARVQTLPTVAGLPVGTFRIHLATDGSASPEGITLEAFQAAAVGSVRLRVAFGFGSTWILDKTGLDAMSFHTNFWVEAFAVTLTSNGFACREVRTD